MAAHFLLHFSHTPARTRFRIAEYRRPNFGSHVLLLFSLLISLSSSDSTKPDICKNCHSFRTQNEFCHANPM